MEDLEWIEKYFRKELSAEESAQFRDRLAADAAFKRKFDAESVVHKALQFSRERERVKSYANPVAQTAPVQWLDNQALVMAFITAITVWIFSTFASGATSLSPDNIKWVGLTVAIAASVVVLARKNKTMNLRLATSGIFNGLIVFVLASGIDAINHGVDSGKEVAKAELVPFTGDKPWWPTQSLEDSLEAHRQLILAMRTQLQTLIASRVPNLNFGADQGRYATVVIPRSSSVISGSTYEADIVLAAAPTGKSIAMQVDGKSIPFETDASGVVKGHLSFTASATTFDRSGIARKSFVAEITVGDSTYTRVVEYTIKK